MIGSSSKKPLSSPSQEQAQLSIFEWIESWYNRRRRHSALGYQTIEELEKNNYKFTRVCT